MEQTAQLGTNKTGIDMSPIDSKEMLEASEKFFIKPEASVAYQIDQFFREGIAPLGSVPLPGTVKGVLKSALKMASGRHPEVLINKLGERLAFERTGVRIYEHLITKCVNSTPNQMTEIRIPVERLTEFRNQESQHFHLLIKSIKSLGADPTAQTPDADAAGITSAGFIKVIADPRTSVSQSLQAMLAVELADNAAWELLIRLAEDMGLSEMATDFRQALHQENTHLVQVKEWYEQSIRSQAGVSVSPG